MAYDVQLKEIEKRATVVVRGETTPDKIGEVHGELLHLVSAYLESKGVQPAGPPFGRFFDYTKEHVDMEAGFPVVSPLDGEGRVQTGELPAGKVAVTWHVGPYTTLSKAYAAMSAWMDEQGLESAGASWEVYWTDPATESDSSTWRTEIVWPVR
jgi:effector-binding domain-containing protein